MRAIFKRRHVQTQINVPAAFDRDFGEEWMC
jgi:hypothetical protein